MATAALIGPLDFTQAAWSGSAMINTVTRRTLLATTGFALIAPTRCLAAAGPQQMTLELVSRDLALRGGASPTRAWRFAPDEVLRFAQGDQAEVTVFNRLPVGASIHWRGLDGAPSLQPLLARPPIPPGGNAIYALSLSHAGTMSCEAWLGPNQATAPVVVAEKTQVEADREVVFLIEDWRLEADGTGTSVQPIYTVNGARTFSLDATPNERLRLRFINGSQQTVSALQLSSTDLRIMAIDGQPSEPFLARDGRLLMAPGTRIDAVVDIAGPGPHAITLNDGARSVALGEITVANEAKRPRPLVPMRPLPSNGLLEQLPLQSALRVELPLDARAPWTSASAMTAAIAPAFRVKRGRPVVLSLGNPGDATAVFHLHGHHMRLLDRLDDGWKPFWLDTVAVPVRQTSRVAFAATHPGLYLMESRGPPDGARTLRSYLVEA